VALSSLALSISVLLHGVPAGHRTGLFTAIEMGLFLGREFHSVPFSSINSYLFGACEPWLGCGLAWRGDVEPRILILRMREELRSFRIRIGSGVQVRVLQKRESREPQNVTNEPIYEREVVKRGGADFVERGSRTSPSPSASVDLAQFGPGHGRSVRATRYTSSESEAERDCSLSIPAMFESWTDVT
jgi:hypothetical protein